MVKNVKINTNNPSFRSLIYLTSQFLLQIITILTMPIFTRILSTEEYGIIAVYSTWLVILSIFINLRSDATISIAKVHLSNDFPQYCSITYIISTVLMMLFLFIGGFLSKPISTATDLSIPLLFFMIIHSFGYSCTRNQLSIFQNEKLAFQHLITNVTISILSVIISLILIYSFPYHRIPGRILGLGMPYIIFGTFFCIYNIKRTGMIRNKELFSLCISLSSPLIFSGIALQILSQSDRLMLSSIRSNAETGIYTFCYSVANPLTGIWGALGNAWKPDYFENLKKRNMQWIKEHSQNYMFLFTSLVCGYLLTSQEFVKILGEKSYWSGSNIVPLIVLVSFCEFLYSFPANYEYYKKETKLVGLGLVLASLINIIFNFILIPIYGMIGAAIATIISYIFLFLIHDAFARKLEGYHYTWNFYFRGIIPVTFCLIYTYFFAYSPLLRWMLAAIIGILLIRRIVKTKSIL